MDVDDYVTELEAKIERLWVALATVLGTAAHGQNLTWPERIKIGRDALEVNESFLREIDERPPGELRRS